VRSIFINENPETGESRGFGFAQMPREDAEKAIEALDGMEVDGRPIKVTKASKKINKTRVYIGNIDYATTGETIQSIIEEFGEIFDFFMPRASDYEGHRGFCIAVLESAVADRAIQELQGVEVDGKILEVKEAKPKGSVATRKQGTKLFIGNLSFYTPIETLREVFGEFGEVFDVFLPLDGETGSPRGFGFITMDSEGAQRAIEELNDAEVDGRYIQVAEAAPKS
jgi:RNA recognition motif-containing protein